MSCEIHEPIGKQFFEQVLSGEKTFALQAGNFNYEKDDILVLEEIDGSMPTGRVLRRRIGWAANSKELGDFAEEDIARYGLEIISLLEEKK
jgi:hypothetical protein